MSSANPGLVAFASHVRAVLAEAVYLVSARGVTALSGPQLDKVAPLLDGTRSLADIERDAGPELSAADIGRLVAQLGAANLLVYRTGPPQAGRDPVADAYWQLAGLDPGQAVSRLSGARVEVLALGRVDPVAASAACRSCGLAEWDPASGDPSGLSLVLCDDYLDPALAEINACHLASGVPWLLAMAAGPDLWVGPVFRPGAGPCWQCLASRLEGHRLPELALRHISGAGQPVRPPETSLPASRAAGLQLAVLEAAKWLAGVRYQGQDAVHTVNSLTLEGRRHAVTHRPQCPACGDPGLVAAQAREPMRVSPCPVAERDGNGYRALTLDQVLGTYGHLVDPVTGIIAEIRRDPGSAPFPHSYLSGPNRAVAGGSLAAVRAQLRAQSGGKGLTDLEARVGALCEAVERYSGSWCGDEFVVRDSFTGLGAKAVHPNACSLFSERQFAARGQWNARCAYLHRVPEPFDERAVIDWTPVWSLITRDQRWLPTAMLYFGHDRDGRGGQPAFVYPDSNGNAAGSSPEDAILQGFFELVERDAVALWWYNRTRQPPVDVDSFDDPRTGQLYQAYWRRGCQVWVLDLTSDLGIPVMAAISRRTSGATDDIAMGFGAHFDPHVAMMRALTELGQMISAGAPGRGNDPHLASWRASATVVSQPYLLPADGPAVSAGDYRCSAHADLAEGISQVCDLAAGAELDILVLDQTRPDIGMPVVKVVVPGLRHFWPRFAPGRLFDVPVRLGRLAERTPYEKLNPVPVYM